ncbi:SDR family oxidoreductase [Cohnella lubricantis]|uniref:SDR family oxidoreductase n=1 Tax=Cohnella lubricantis TaxID=2163172 RepID=A0A841TAG9_9BACL|nr:SDR family oxidoreductase [Cohnella lubricantis]MBB6678294.1 SDR family oxidoreductase [Cohnella lubricantis]
MLAGKTALVTGSAKGLGWRTAMELARLGCNVAINYVNSEAEAKQAVGDIQAMGREAAAIRADIADAEEAKRLVGETEARLGGVDILVNNAGPFIRERRLFADYSEEEIHYLMNGNLVGTMLLDHRVLPGMRERQWGRIIHFGFGHAAEARSWPQRAVYAAAKVGLVSFTKTLAVEEAANGITVNMICPGDIRGDFKEKGISDVNGVMDEEAPRGRPGTGEDVARVIGFLCLPESDFVTGNAIEVSGGLDPIVTTVKRN